MVIFAIEYVHTKLHANYYRYLLLALWLPYDDIGVSWDSIDNRANQSMRQSTLRGRDSSEPTPWWDTGSLPAACGA